MGCGTTRMRGTTVVRRLCQCEREFRKDSKVVVTQGFGLDVDKGIVKFSRPMYKTIAVAGGDDEYGAAELRLRVAFNWRTDTGFWTYRYDKFPKKEGDPTTIVPGTEIAFHRRELFTIMTENYILDFEGPHILHNNDTVRAIAQDYADAIEKQFVPYFPTEAVYVGFYWQQFQLTGSIRSVEFRFDCTGNEGITTTVRREDDTPPYGNTSYAELRNASRISSLGDMLITNASWAAWGRRHLARERPR